MTTITFKRTGELEVNTEGKIVVVPTASLAFDQDLRDLATLAMQHQGEAIPVPNTSRLPRPKHSIVFGVGQ